MKQQRIKWHPGTVERYCVDTGFPVRQPGDRCRGHGNSNVMCYTATRDPRCQHPRVSENHPYPFCSECGRVGKFVEIEQKPMATDPGE